MSNIIKYNYIFYDGKDRKVIDSNKKINLIPLEKVVTKDDPPEFVEGLNPIPVENVFAEQETEEETPEEILANAKLEAEEILEHARMEAEALKNNLLKEAEQQGYEDGYNKAIHEVDKLKQDLNKNIAKNQQEYEEAIAALEPQMVEVMAELIEGLTGILVKGKKEVLLYLVNKVMTNTDNKRFVIRVASGDYEFLSSNKEMIYGALKKDISIEIMEDSKLVENQCLIETESSLINASLDVQLNNLITDLKIISL